MMKMRMDFSAENKIERGAQFPKFTLSLEEVARVGILEAPILKFVHVLKAPVVDPVTGEWQQVTKKNSKGEEYDTNAEEFVSQVVCAGDLATVRENEIDPDNCVACASVAQHADRFNAPEAKYIAHIVRYKTQPGTINPQTPFQAELLLWVLTQKKFNKIVNIASEFGDPRTLDLQIGPCTSKNFQNYDIAACNGAAIWSSDEQKKAFVSQLWETNAANEQQMADTVARPLSPTRYAADEAKVNGRFEMLGRPQSSQGVMGMEFGGIAQASQQMSAQADQPAPWSQQGPPSFAQPQAAPAPAEAPFQAAAPPGFAQPQAQPFQAPQESQPAQAAPQAPAQQAPAQQAPAQPAQGGTMNFADLMGMMGQGN